MIIPLGISSGSHDRDTCDWDGDTMIAPTGPGTTGNNIACHLDTTLYIILPSSDVCTVKG